MRVPNYATILNILYNFKKWVAEYIKYNYNASQIRGAPELNRTVAIEETLIIHENDIKFGS